MTNAQRTWHVAGPKISISPIVGMGLVVAVLAIGVVAVARQASTQQSTTPAIVVPAIDSAHLRADAQWAKPAPAFDAVRFRAEEHAAFAPQAPFDAVAFRAEEHAAIVQPSADQPTYWRPYDSSTSNPTFDVFRYLSERGLLSTGLPFDAVAFRAEEHAAFAPLAPYNDSLYNAQRRARTDGPQTTSSGGRGIQAR